MLPMNSNFRGKSVINKNRFTIVLLLATSLIISTTFMTITIKPIYGQNIDKNSEDNTNITSSSKSIKSLEKLRSVNLTQISEQPPIFESLTPGKPIDFENIDKLQNREKVIEFLKEEINTEALNFESPITATTITIDPEITQKLNYTDKIKNSFNNQSSMKTNPSTNINNTRSLFSGTSVSWDGLNSNTGCPSGCFPPDVTVAASEDHVVEMVNVALQVWDKSGTSLVTTPLSSFYGSGSDFIFDPKIVYDRLSGHWFGALANAKDLDPATGQDHCDTTSTCSILIAVSTTNNPLDPWSIYEFPFPGYFPDQPIIATSDDKLAISVNDFDNAQCSNGCAQVYVADKAAMIAGTTVSYQSTSPDPTVFSIHPAQSLSSSSCVNMISTINPTGSSQLRLDNACGNPATGSVIFNHVGDITMSASQVPPNARQIGGTIETNDARIQTAVYSAGKIWTGFNDACSVDGSTFQACARLVKIDMPTMSLDVDTYIAATDIDTYFPAVTMNNIGDLLVILGTSGPSSNPSLLVGGDNPWNFVDLVVGSDKVSEPRYGDYFGAGQDPSGQSSAWVAGEYGTSALPDHWSTFVGKIS
jgi:hypothetical protein